MTAEYTLTPKGNATLLDLTTETQTKSRPDACCLRRFRRGVSRRRVMNDCKS